MTFSMRTPYLELVGEAKLAERVQNDYSDEIIVHYNKIQSLRTTVL
jgi:hypothetical protein